MAKRSNMCYVVISASAQQEDICVHLVTPHYGVAEKCRDRVREQLGSNYVVFFVSSYFKG